MSEFHKFPHTPHLLWLGTGSPRDDKILTPSQVGEFLSGGVIIEEKVDGANMGLSIGPDGRVSNLQLLSGSPLLVQAARDAVQQWQYKPHVVDGRPVSVVTG